MTTVTVPLRLLLAALLGCASLVVGASTAGATPTVVAAHDARAGWLTPPDRPAGADRLDRASRAGTTSTPPRLGSPGLPTVGTPALGVSILGSPPAVADAPSAADRFGPWAARAPPVVD